MSRNDEHNMNNARIAAESRLRIATDLLDRIVACVEDHPISDTSWWRDYYLFTGQHMILTDEGWEDGSSKQSYLDMEAEHPEYAENSILEEVNAPTGGIA